MRYLNNSPKNLILIFVFSILSLSVKAQWNIPETAKNAKPSVDVNYKSAEEGKKLFEINCIACHGMPGKGQNNKAINATDLGSNKFQSERTVGDVFYQINEGKGQMPSFKDRFAEEEKWHIAIYIKSFDDKFEMSGEKIESLNGKITVIPDDKDKILNIKAFTIDENGNEIPVKNSGIEVSVKRIFGNLPVSEDLKTDENGKASFKFPEDIPGDEKGMLKVFISFSDTDKYGTETITKDLAWGTELKVENDTLKRSLWGSNQRVPIWLLITYLSITLGVWAVILYVVFQITRIKKL